MSIESAHKYADRMRGYLGFDEFISKALILADTKDKCKERNTTLDNAEAVYGIMCESASQFGFPPFKDKDRFFEAFKAHCSFDEGIDWESLVVGTAQGPRYSGVTDALFKEYSERFKLGADTVLIAEAASFIPNLKKLVDEHCGCHFTMTAAQISDLALLQRIFAGYKNVKVTNANIYTYGFTNARYDLIFCVPAFAGRSLADDPNFMCKELDSVALENLLLHTANGGELLITMPARITYGQGKTGELRKFVEQNYRLKEIDELPEGIFDGVGIKTYLIDIMNARPGDDDIIVRRYRSEKRKNRREAAKSLSVEEETFVMADELKELGDWNINRIFSQQDEEWLKFQDSSVRRFPMGDVAEIFRGKAVNQKDPTGAIGVVNISNIGEYDINYDELDHLDEEERKVTNYVLQESDVLIPARGTAIRTAIFHPQSYPCIASSNIIVIRPDKKRLSSTYLKLFLDSPLGQKMVSGVQQGITVINISYKDLKALEIPVPSIEEQQRKADEYEKELRIYQDSITAAQNRWNEVIQKLREF